MAVITSMRLRFSLILNTEQELDPKNGFFVFNRCVYRRRIRKTHRTPSVVRSGCATVGDPVALRGRCQTRLDSSTITYFGVATARSHPSWTARDLECCAAHAPPKAKGVTYDPGIHHHKSSVSILVRTWPATCSVALFFSVTTINRAMGNSDSARALATEAASATRTVRHLRAFRFSRGFLRARFVTHLARRVAQPPPSSRFRNTRYAE